MDNNFDANLTVPWRQQIPLMARPRLDIRSIVMGRLFKGSVFITMCLYILFFFLITITYFVGFFSSKELKQDPFEAIVYFQLPDESLRATLFKELSPFVMSKKMSISRMFYAQPMSGSVNSRARKSDSQPHQEERDYLKDLSYDLEGQGRTINEKTMLVEAYIWDIKIIKQLSGSTGFPFEIKQIRQSNDKYKDFLKKEKEKKEKEEREREKKEKEEREKEKKEKERKKKEKEREEKERIKELKETEERERVKQQWKEVNKKKAEEKEKRRKEKEEKKKKLEEERRMQKQDEEEEKRRKKADDNESSGKEEERERSVEEEEYFVRFLPLKNNKTNKTKDKTKQYLSSTL